MLSCYHSIRYSLSTFSSFGYFSFRYILSWYTDYLDLVYLDTACLEIVYLEQFVWIWSSGTVCLDSVPPIPGIGIGMGLIPLLVWYWYGYQYRYPYESLSGISIGMSSSIGMVQILIPGIGIGMGIIPILTQYRYQYEGLSSIGTNHKPGIGIGMNPSLVLVSVLVSV